MADLSARAVEAGEDLSVNDDAAAYTCAKRDDDHAREALTAALPILAECCDIGIVANLNADTTQHLREVVLHIHDAPAEIYADVHDAAFQNRSGDIDTDAENFLFADLLLRCLILDGLRDIRQDAAAVVLGPRRNLPFLKEFSLCIKKAALHCSAAHINTKRVLRLTHLMNPPETDC